MSNPENYPQPIPLKTPRAARQRQRDHDGRPDRVAELAADVEAYAQRARWSLTVEQAERLVRAADYLGEGVHVSGDHRPTFRGHRHVDVFNLMR